MESTHEGPQMVEFEATDSQSDFLSTGTGMRVVPTEFREAGELLHKPEAYNFVKWARLQEPALTISLEDAEVIDLRSDEYYLPLVFLASDVTLPFYLNLAANYVHEMARGALRHDRTSVHLEAVHIDKKAGKMKRFKYSGSEDGLRACVKKFDLESVMRDE